MLDRHDAVPHFTVRTISGSTLAYASIWQQRHLVLIAVPAMDSREASDYIARVAERLDAMRDDTTVVITRDPVAGLPAPAVLVADRWGEIAEVVHARQIADLPSPEDVLEWIEHVRQRCPECEGEAR